MADFVRITERWLVVKIFVYGSLKHGYMNHCLLEGQKYLGQAKTTNGYTLYDMGVCPIMVIAGDDYVEGELYECDADTVLQLDRLEGHPGLYTRCQIVIRGYEEEATYAYLFLWKLSPNTSVHCGRKWDNTLCQSP